MTDDNPTVSEENAAANPVTADDGLFENPAPDESRLDDSSLRAALEAVLLVVDTPATAGTFGPLEPVPLEDGQTYYFRCRARDTAGNLGVYAAGDGDTWTTLYKEAVYLPLITR